MQELVGKLSALDPDASESLKVIGFFDKLVSAQANMTALARSASVLAGVPAGLTLGEEARTVRATPRGSHSSDAAPGDWPSAEIGSGGRVWIERDGEPHANDSMLLERFALAVSITNARVAFGGMNDSALELAVDAAIPPEERTAAVRRLRLDLHGHMRAIALPGDVAAPTIPTRGLLSTPFGFAQVLLVDASFSDFGERAGVGIAVEHAQLPQSWSSALTALRLSDEANPIVFADQLGPLLLLAEIADASSEPHPDVVSLSLMAHDRKALPTLDAVVDRGSVRGAAVSLGLHHSTVQARLSALTGELGYDVRTVLGRTRFTLARTLQRLHDARL